ncbi:alpha/beta fold hydrolase [Bradyrhizobium sp. 2TAF24]|uniref:alpha/beta fold hydrolase n=1 Tax=Bradyrhizobium sp. 2TAF24 TaxID=3233011 RepID=UPI003F8DBBD4
MNVITAGFTDADTRMPLRPVITTRDGLRLFHKDWGTGAPILFVHAWSMSSDFWEYQMVPLAAQGLRCIAFDRRGNGRSEDNGTGYSLDALSDDLACVIEQLDLDNVTLVGHSLGASEVVRYLARHGSGRVTRAVLVAGGTPPLVKSADNPDGIDKAMFDAVRDALLTDRAKWLRDNAAPFFTADTSPGLQDWTMAMMMQSSLRAMVETVYLSSMSDLRPDLRRIDVPVLVIHGTADQSIPYAFGQRTLDHVADGRMITYEGAPHGLLVTHAARLRDDIAAFAAG